MNDLAAGIALCVAAFFFGLRQIFLDPKSKGWPPAPSLVRVALFVMMLDFAYWGVMIAYGALHGRHVVVDMSHPLVWAPAGFYSVVMWFNVARQNYPADVWRRIERIMTLAQCKNATILVEAARAGWLVMMPGRKGDAEPIGPADIAEPSGIPVHEASLRRFVNADLP